jgi:16S rRNA (guanine1207-N2)-methyltransferase
VPDDDGPPIDGESYFAERPRSESRPHELRFLYRGELLIFGTDAGVFARHGLDPGTALLISALDPAAGSRLLDLGCGWGAVGIAAARAAPTGQVVLTDVNKRALRLARANVARNRVRNAEVRAGPGFRPVAGDRFDLIATNPPYRIGRPAILALFDAARDHLAPGGRLLFVGKGSQGALFYQHYLTERWGGPVRVVARGGGYRVVEARNGAAIDHA